MPRSIKAKSKNVQTKKGDSIKSTPKQVFLHLMMMAMYAVMIVSTTTLLIQYIRIFFPDELTMTYASQAYDGIRVASSALMVAFPIFLFTNRWIRRSFNQNPEEKKMSLRKWLIYLSLFLSGGVMIIDLIVFINGFYNGDLGVQFALKSLTVLVLSGLTFAYFLRDISEAGIPSAQAKKLTVASLVVWAFVLGSGFALVGTPSTQRAFRFDAQRTMDLENLEAQVLNYWNVNKVLPLNLEDLKSRVSTGWYNEVIPVDPETQEAYTYEVLTPSRFKICATFALDSEKPLSANMPTGKWEHLAGETCFERETSNSIPSLIHLKP